MELHFDGVKWVETHVGESASDSSNGGADKGLLKDGKCLKQGIDFGGGSCGGFEPVLRDEFWI